MKRKRSAKSTTTARPRSTAKTVMRSEAAEKPKTTVTEPAVPVASELGLSAPSLAPDNTINQAPENEVISPKTIPSAPVHIDSATSMEKSVSTPQPEPTNQPETETFLPPSAEEVQEIRQWSLNRTVFVFGIGFAMGIALATVGIFWFWKSQPPPQEQAIAPAEEEASAPLPIAFDTSAWAVEVLNGSGTAGAARKAAETLSDRGYIVTRTGNAVSQDFPQTQVYVIEEKEKSTEELLNDLQQDFPTATLSGTFEPVTDSTASARIIIGRQ